MAFARIKKISGYFPTRFGHYVIIFLVVFFSTGERVEDLVRWLELDQCHPFDETTATRNWHAEKRACLPGHISFIRWNDPNPIPDQPNLVLQGPNRALQVDHVAGNLAVWREVHLETSGWKKNDQLIWISGPSGDNVPFNLINPALANGIAHFDAINPELVAGMVLKRIDYTEAQCSVALKNVQINVGNAAQTLTIPSYVSGDAAAVVPIMEFWVANTAGSDKCQMDICHQIYWRWTMARCNESLSTEPGVAGPFQPFANLRIDRLLKD